MKKVFASIITIGDELLIGQTIDTNSAWISQQLNQMGIWVCHRLAVGDVREEILDALKYECAHSELILITGGLGPTNDDITKTVLCEYFHCSFREDRQTLEHIKKMFVSRNIPILESNLRQALVPDCCTVIPNDYGTAPCMWFKQDHTLYISMPGVPHEMQGIMTDRILPELKKVFSLPVILHRTVITMGLGESQVADRLMSFEKSLPADIRLAYLPGNGLLKLRLTARGDLQQMVANELDQYYGVLKDTLQDIIVVEDDIPLEAWIGGLLKKGTLTISTAESCTGGLIAHKITSIPGSSAYYKGTIVSYANQIKEKILKVPAEILEKYGAVSKETVVAMVKGANTLMHTDIAVAVSGIMGPDGGSPEKPVGTVWIAAASGDKVLTRKYHLRYSRSRNTEITANYALKMLGEAIMDRNKRV